MSQCLYPGGPDAAEFPPPTPSISTSLASMLPRLSHQTVARQHAERTPRRPLRPLTSALLPASPPGCVCRRCSRIAPRPGCPALPARAPSQGSPAGAACHVCPLMSTKKERNLRHFDVSINTGHKKAHVPPTKITEKQRHL